MSDVTILFGGTSSERRVAVASGQNVASFLPDAQCWSIAQSVHLSPDPRVMRETLRDMLAVHERIVAKPIAGGSSFGLYHLGGEADVEKTAQGIEASGENYLAEQFVEGTELTVGVVDGPSGPRALPP